MKIRTLILKTILASAFSLALIVNLSSCGKKSISRVKPNDKGEIEEISVVVQSETGEYDPAGAAAYVYFSHQSFSLSPLVSYTKDGAFIPATAESWEISDDLLTYTFHIRQNAKWSDGSDVTAADYINTIKRSLEPENGAWYVDFLFTIKNAKECFDGKVAFDEVGVKALNSKTIQYTLYEIGRAHV